MKYSVIVEKRALKELEGIPKNIRVKILDILSGLENNPRPVGYIKLKGNKDNYRIRVGDYRIIYSIHDNILTVYVIGIPNRKDAYL